MDERFLVFDVDNTITESCKEISDEMAKTLEKLEQGIVFISGTNITELKRMISSKLKRKHHLLGNTGTHYVIKKENLENEIINNKLSKDEKKEIIQALKKLKEKYKLLPLTTENDQIQDRGSQITFSILGRNAPSEKKYIYDTSKDKRKKFVEYLKTILKDSYEMTIGGTTSIDITRKGIDKGESLLNFIKINNTKKENTTFFGDQLEEGGNDYPVKKLGIKCIEVKNPEDTIQILKKFIKNKNSMLK
ncbi:hypothetical protein COU59_03300 [Candidatus Pacearchaeota archaeon CG10_big_fil_rev_8_21_14_0_10_34_12]|nr:MAG: hypothetical protein COU59_03300 [Candidatus Pacearchaeota archaeon CG10_big_fil_rev_8_21_14_0_10_34_12]